MTDTPHPIRPATADDAPALMSISESSGLFGPEEMEAMQADIAAFAAGEAARHWLIHDADRPAGAAMLAEEPMSGAVWNMLFVGTRPDVRRRGLGRALVSACEDAARARGGRLLLIDTASIEEFVPARALYERMGYAREAVIRDFYADGMDRVTYARRL